MRDDELIEQVLKGDRESLDLLMNKHQGFVYNVALKMLNNVDDARDAVQEILIKVMTNLGKYDSTRAKFTTWMYRITCNHILNFRNSSWEKQGVHFENFFEFMENIPDTTISDEELEFMDESIEEAKVTCTSGMLMCLDREQRLIYILGDIFRLDQSLASDILETTPGNFRVKLTRARKDLHNWMHQKCGLVNEENPCRCRNKTKKLIEMGEVDPVNKKWLSGYTERIRDVVSNDIQRFGDSKDELYNKIYQEHPFKSNLNAKEIYQEILDNKDFADFMKL